MNHSHLILILVILCIIMVFINMNHQCILSESFETVETVAWLGKWNVFLGPQNLVIEIAENGQWGVASVLMATQPITHPYSYTVSATNPNEFTLKLPDGSAFVCYYSSQKDQLKVTIPNVFVVGPFSRFSEATSYPWTGAWSFTTPNGNNMNIRLEKNGMAGFRISNGNGFIGSYNMTGPYECTTNESLDGNLFRMTYNPDTPQKLGIETINVETREVTNLGDATRQS